MNLFHANDDGSLLFSSAIGDEWQLVIDEKVSVVIDLEGDLDHGCPTCPDQMLYVYFPIYDEGLPDLHKLHAVARLGATLLQAGHKVLSHCGMGFNRSALVAGLILKELGMSGPDVLRMLRSRRPGVLFNEIFATYVAEGRVTVPDPTLDE